MKTNLKDMSLQRLQHFIESNDMPKFRAKQIYDWMYKGVTEFDEMKNLPKDMINTLKDIAYIGTLEIVDKIISSDGTIKYLFKLEDSNIIESVCMKYSFGNTACISTQVGCKMACSFCASGIGGYIRNLSSGEMIDQIMSMSLDIGERISRVVLMGSGEPMDNFDNVVNFLYNVNQEEGLNIGLRKITVSTCGISNRIYDFADKNMQVNLSISLHAPNDAIRNSIMPISKKYSIAEIIKACRYYTKKTGRRVTFEYSLIKDVNSSKQNAQELAATLKGMLCHVNLIPVNNVTEKGYKGPSNKEIQIFAEVLKRSAIPVTIRRELGSDINAACGQLRINYLKEKLN